MQFSADGQLRFPSDARNARCIFHWTILLHSSKPWLLIWTWRSGLAFRNPLSTSTTGSHSGTKFARRGSSNSWNASMGIDPAGGGSTMSFPQRKHAWRSQPLQKTNGTNGKAVSVHHRKPRSIGGTEEARTE